MIDRQELIDLLEAIEGDDLSSARALVKAMLKRLKEPAHTSTEHSSGDAR